MAEVVLILGAGASKQAGAPLMVDFLDRAQELLRRNKVGDAEADFKRVFDGIAQLQQVHSKAQLNLQNIESVFAAFEMARTVGGFADYSQDDTDALVRGLRRLIVTTLHQTIALPVKPEGRQVLPPPPYDRFASLCSNLGRGTPSRTAAVITFNYDVGVDQGFHWNGVRVDYGLDETVKPAGIPLLKLHGSINWGRCGQCQKVVPWHLGDYFREFRWDNLFDAKYVTMPIGTQLDHLQHCDTAVGGEPVLVPPTWNKTEYHRSLGSVWTRAARELKEADSILVFGFSLPPSDAFFSHLYALGTAGGVPLRRFWVYDPDTSGTVERRFRALLGPGAEQRFRFFNDTFENAIGLAAREYGVSAAAG